MRTLPQHRALHQHKYVAVELPLTPLLHAGNRAGSMAQAQRAISLGLLFALTSTASAAAFASNQTTSPSDSMASGSLSGLQLAENKNRIAPSWN
jgi:hypothetical protein